ncbi:sugar transferase [Campylobacter sp. MIT 12-8780]|uniref:galactosyltransferase-related protein n=1 Tax=unclassified Campylobacter TaxID=2593542 RepID=UPI00115E9473|nr:MULTISPECIES: galactosyltransferase-related protein [unclassified Campylobacter]NDJ26880.1 sugar transferase [Campylobacter sp. MIT 19-121]TQR41976.1 sugar transferase [Campylobacter sp. MIT 12-8780]
MKNPKLSIIIPFGLSVERAYIKERVLQKACAYKSDEKVEYIFVEGFSSCFDESVKECIVKSGHIYIKDEIQVYFSQGKCRNLGAINARANVVMFLDVDCEISPQSLAKLLELICVKGIDANPNALLLLPCIYLKQEASEFLLSQSPNFWDTLVQNDLLNEQKMCKFLAFFSSSFIMHKYKFLELGGNDEGFVGHGYEDFDLFARALKACVHFEKMPANLAYDSRNWHFNEFKGFRALFSLLGYESAFYSLFVYHFWHIEPNQNNYLSNKEANHRLFFTKLEKYFKDEQSFLQSLPQVLQRKEAQDQKVLVLSKELLSFRIASVYFGSFVYKEFQNETEFLSFLEQEKIALILFNASYLSSQIQFLECIKQHRLEYAVCELQKDKNELELWHFKEFQGKIINENLLQEISNFQAHKKSFYPLKSLIFKPYIYELKHTKFKLLPAFLEAKLSQTKFYRLFRKLMCSPKEFFRDSKFISQMRFK